MRDAVMESLSQEMARMDARAERCPKCERCGERITADEYYYDLEGMILCERCLNIEYRRSVEV